MQNPIPSSPITDLRVRIERCYRIDARSKWDGRPDRVEVYGLVFRRGRGDRARGRRPVIVTAAYPHSQLAVAAARDRLFHEVASGRLPLG